MGLRGLISAAAGAAGVWLTQAGGQLESPPARGFDKIDVNGFDLFKKGLFDQVFYTPILEYFITRC